jgi:hypothetical protein
MVRRRGSMATLGALVALVALTGVAAPVAAEDCERWVEREVPDPTTESGYRLEMQCVERGGGPPADSGDDGGQPVDTGPPSGGFFSVGVGEDDDGESCWRPRWHDSPGYEPNEDSWTWEDAYEAGDEFFEDHPPCPGADEPDPTGAVLSLWATTEFLPGHEPAIAPGWALTGMPAYLEIDGARTHETSMDLPAPFDGSAGITASATYTVDWGDGTVSEGLASTGGPYPDGDIVHTYADTDEVTVEVTAVWSGTWEIGGAGGDLPPIELTETLPLEIRELQSVRTGG